MQFDKLLEQHSNDPEVLLLESRTRARLGDVLEMMGQHAEAEQNYRDAITSLQALESRLPGDDRPLRAKAAPTMDWDSCSASSIASARPSHGFATRSASASSSPPGRRAIVSWPGPSRTAATTWVPY